MIYMSIVGHQIMAILNPLLSLPRGEENTLAFFMTDDEKTRQHVATIRDRMSGQSDLSVHFIQISSSLVRDSSGNPPAHEAIAKFVQDYSQKSQEIFFNLSGGMNFQIAACVCRLDKFSNIKYLYPDFYGTKVYAPSGEGLVSKYLPIPQVTDIFKLQGVKVKKLKGEMHHKVKDILRAAGAALPANAECNVMVEGMHFDFIINHANTISFCKFFDGESSSLEEIREMIGKAVNRNELAELFNRRILVLTNRNSFAERFLVESQGKIEVVRYYEKNNKISMKSAGKKVLMKFVCSEPPPPPPTFSQQSNTRTAKDIAKKTADRNTLYVFLGREVLPTLKAIWSHRAEKTCLFYTPGDRRVEFCKERLVEYATKNLLPSQEFSCFPVSFHAEELEIFPLPPECPFEINVTPGTKAHTFFLTRLALRGGGKVMSINNKSGKVEEINGNGNFPVAVPSLNHFLSLSVESRDIWHGSGKKGISKKTNSMEAILTFLGKINNQQRDISDFFQYEMSLPGVQMKRAPRSFELQFIPTPQPGRILSQLTYSYNTQPNKWFEELVAYVMLKCGADEILLGVKSFWIREETIGHRSELDICFIIEKNLYVISCKSGKSANITESAVEVQSTAASLGRFAIPMVAALKYSDEPKKIGKTWVFGYKTLADRKKMKALLESAREELATTY